jgi:hypothetical protein
MGNITGESIIYTDFPPPIAYSFFETETETVRGRVGRTRVVPRVNPTRRNSDEDDDF